MTMMTVEAGGGVGRVEGVTLDKESKMTASLPRHQWSSSAMEVGGGL